VRTVLQARYFLAHRTMSGLARAEVLLERAIQIEPEFARTHATLAHVHYLVHEYSSTPRPDLVDRIIETAQRAAALDSTLAEPWAALGGAYERRQRPADAEAAYDRAIALNPRHATVHHWRAWLLGYLGPHEEAFATVGRAVALEPMSLIINTAVGEHLLNLHRHEEALGQFRHVLEMDSMFVPAIGLYAVASSIRGDHASAVSLADWLLALPGVRSRYDLGRAAFALGNAGHRERAQQILVEMERRGLWAFTAQGWLALGKQERALKALDRALRAEDPSLPRVITIEVATVPLFNHPRVVSLRQRMNLP
jgi:tetratricopeptide (TPR) repeat protein